VDRTGVPILTREIFYAIHIILILKGADHEGMALLGRTRLLKWILLVFLPVIQIQIPICAFLSSVPSTAESNPGLPGVCLAAASWMPALTPCKSGKLYIGFVYIALLILLLLVLLVKLF